MISTDPRFDCSDQERNGTVYQSPFLQKRRLLTPLTSDLSGQCGEESLGSKLQDSTDLVGDSGKKRPAGELICGLSLRFRENPRRVCRICHRHFSSGRALGGHMRVHGSLFQSSSSKREPNHRKSAQGASYGVHMDFLESKSIDLSLLSGSLSEKQGLSYDGIHESIMTSDSDGEAVDDALASETYLYNIGRVKIPTDHHMSDLSTNKHAFIKLASNNNARPMTKVSGNKRDPLYTLRRDSKKRFRFAEDRFTMGMFSAGQNATAAHLASRGSLIPSLERPRVCSECGKSFWSWKALFGHMRCHPERDWRGMSPPDSSLMLEERIRRAKKKLLFGDNSVTANSNFEMNFNVENKGFSTEIESYRMKKDTAPIKPEQVTEHDFDAEEGLNKISKEAELFADSFKEYDGYRWWPTAKRSRRKLLEVKAEDVQQACPFPQRDKPGLASDGGSVEEVQHLETPNFLLMLAEAARTIEFKHRGELYKGEVVPSMKVKQHPQAAATSSIGVAKYECCTCKKVFNSHQALGGHRASHRKMKGCFARNSEGDGIEEYDLWQHAYSSMPAGGRDIEQQQRKDHECSICHRMFPTGQALGGHKRCHYTSEKAAEAASFTSCDKHIVSEDGNLTAKGQSTIDLNMPAPLDENGENGGMSLQSQWFDKLSEESNHQSSMEFTLSSWASKGIIESQQRNSPWEVDRRWAQGAAVVC